MWSSTESYSDNISGGASGAIMAAGGKLVLLSAEGWLSVVDATSAGYTVVYSNAQVNTDYNSSFPFAVPPTIANGIMYVRGTYSTLSAYQVGTNGGGSAPVITSGPTASGTVGQQFPAYTITASGSTPMTYGAANLPSGLGVNASSGAITGIPAAACTNAVIISASNAYGFVTANLTITIAGAGSGTPPTITSALACTGTVGQAFSYQMTANGSLPITYDATGLPPGLGVNASGAITGTPTTNGVTAATIKAVNSYGTNSATLTITINTAPATGAALYQINCGGTNVPPFTADNGVGYYVSGGSPWTIAADVDLSGVSSPAPMAVYESARYTDNLGYIFSNLTVGAKYKLRLHFADIFNITVGPRVFNIQVLHSSQVISNFDVAAAAGGANTAVIKEFTVVADNNGQVDVWLHYRWQATRAN